MDKNKLKDIINFIADKQGFRPAIIEKDYHLTKILNAVNEHLSRDIIFKGGTLLNKAYLNYHRLSEDLDFSYRNDVDVSTRGKRSKAITSIRKKMPSFLSFLGLTSDNPEGRGFNNSTQYLFNLQFQSIIMKRKESIKFEISLRQPSFLSPTTVQVKHFYQDPFSGEDLFPQGSVLALSLEECAAEKLKAAISRLTPAIRDYYDLVHFIKIGFDFTRPDLLKLVNKKLELDGYKRDYSYNLGLSDQAIEELKRVSESDLTPMIRADEKFDLDEVFAHFNKLFRKRK
ncbi:MAG: nucleotidyl transferase AbiEii/AbiGii toxin family protein [Candidatus Omnitrophica bacterium]|nr:nucleotidyl transferase AbiEii/AbiGii toxin family protein [Candidatus Omnitrophota bacterium]